VFQVLWFSSVPALKAMVFLRPSWLFDVLKQVFRHDLDTVTFTPDETLKAIVFTPSKFERLKQELLTEGIVDRELLKGLLVSLMPADISKPSMEVTALVVARPILHGSLNSVSFCLVIRFSHKLDPISQFPFVGI
jgi:hypothetical protein